MSEQEVSFPPFKMAVSDKSSHKLGAQQVKSEQLVYYYAFKDSDDTPIYLQALNQDFIPGGRKLEIKESDFARKYKPEPRVYLNKVKPAMDNLNECLEKGDQLREKGKFKAAENKYQQALELDPDNIRASFGLGISYLAMGDIDNSQHLFEKLVEVDLTFSPEYKHLFNEFGIQLRKNKMFDQGLEYYRRALYNYRNDENLYFNVGRILYEMEQYDEALENLNAALDINPDLGEALKMAKFVQGKVEQVESDRKTIELAMTPHGENNEP